MLPVAMRWACLMPKVLFSTEAIHFHNLTFSMNYWGASNRMARPISKVAPGWWDYTTLESEILQDAAALSAQDLAGLSREGFQVTVYDTLQEFYCAEALEYVHVWKQATPDNPVGICGPIGPTEQLPI